MYIPNTLGVFIDSFLMAGVGRPCVETELTATEKSATDGDRSVTILGRQKRACDRIQLVADRKYPIAASRPCSILRHKLSYDRDQLYPISCRSSQTFLTRRLMLKFQLTLVAVSSIVSQGRRPF